MNSGEMPALFSKLPPGFPSLTSHQSNPFLPQGYLQPEILLAAMAAAQRATNVQRISSKHAQGPVFDLARSNSPLKRTVQKSRKPYFFPYISYDTMMRGLKSGDFLKVHFIVDRIKTTILYFREPCA